MKNKQKGSFRFWVLIWCLGIAGQLCWNMENQWFNTFIYAKIARDPTIISWMTAVSAAATTVSTFLFGTLSDRRGRRKRIISVGYILWGVFTILFGLTQYITGGQLGASSQLVLVAGISVVAADAIMSFFGSMGNDSGFNAWANDNMNDSNRGQIGAAIATQPVIGTIVGTVLGGMLVGENDNYMRLFLVMGGAVIIFGILSLVLLKESPDLKPHVDGSFAHQFFSVFNFKKYFAMKELVWVNLSLAVYFIAFNVFFSHLGNYMIYYLHFTPDMMGYIEGIALVLAMVFVIPAIGLINKNLTPHLCFFSVIFNCIGLLVLGLVVKPENIDTTSLLNPILLGAVFAIGLGYVLILQSLTVWSKQLYPEDMRGQFEGIRILFNVLIPMIVAPLIATPVIKRSGEFINEYGFVEYLPTNTLFLVSSVLVLLTFIPLAFATYYFRKRLKEQKALQAEGEDQ